MSSHDHNWDEDERFDTLFASANHDALPPDAAFLDRLRSASSTEVFLRPNPIVRHTIVRHTIVRHTIVRHTIVRHTKKGRVSTEQYEYDVSGPPHMGRGRGSAGTDRRWL